MDDILSFDILEEVITTDPDPKLFKEFCNDLNALDDLLDPRFYLEAMVDNNKTVIDRLRMPLLKNTRKTTKDVFDVYGNLASGGGTLTRSVWDMAIKAIKLAAKIIKSLLINLSKIPKFIIDVAQTIGRIPENVKNKIRGNIELFITINDVNSLYKTIIPIIDDFLINANNMTKGDMWGTFFNRRPAGNGPISKYVPTKNDMAYYRKMKSYYESLKLIDFNETVVKLEHQNVVDMYFGDTKSVQYIDASGNKVQSTFYDALVNIFNDFQEQSDFLKEIQTNMSEKFDRSQLNQAFARLNPSAQNIIADSMQMISKVINIIGNLIRYSMKDMKTLKISANKILARSDVKRVKKESFEYSDTDGELYQECVVLFEEKSAKVDKKTLRSLTPEEKKIADERFGKIECSIMHDKNGYFAHTHRARTDFYPTLEALPKAKVNFVSSTS